MPSTYTSINIHVIFSTKLRQPILPRHALPRIHEYLGGALRSMGCLPLRVGGIEDHVHILARFGATACLANVVRDLKRSSTKWIREELAVTGFSWQEGYAALSVSSERLAVVERYIARQAEHHRKISAKDELLKLLAYAQIEFDSKYLE